VNAISAMFTVTLITVNYTNIKSTVNVHMRLEMKDESPIPVSSMDVWLEARRRCRNHLRQAFVERGIRPHVVAKMDMEAQIDDLLRQDNAEYIRVAFVRLKVTDYGEENE
jgi:hypothetical protein